MLDELSHSLVRHALAEDMGGYGDVTSAWTVPAQQRGRAEIIAREPLVVSGLPLAAAVVQEIDESCVFAASCQDGAYVSEGSPVVSIEGSVRSLLGAERTVLNFLSHLSGVATQSRRFAEAVEGTGARVVDTRKTTPGLRSWEKQAVRHGGCANHRYGLFDLVLIKNNHLRAAGGVRQAMESALAARPHYLLVEVEVESAADLREAVEAGADIIMLDNQDVASLRELVQTARGLKPDVLLEASGGVTLDSVRAIAETGVDLISTSAITMGAPPVNLSMTLRSTGMTKV